MKSLKLKQAVNIMFAITTSDLTCTDSIGKNTQSILFYYVE